MSSEDHVLQLLFNTGPTLKLCCILQKLVQSSFQYFQGQIFKDGDTTASLGTSSNIQPPIHFFFSPATSLGFILLQFLSRASYHPSALGIPLRFFPLCTLLLGS